MKYKKSIIFFLFIVLLLGAYIVYTQLSNPVLNNVSEESIQEEDQYATVDITYPVFSEHEWLQEDIQRFIEETKTLFEDNVAVNSQARIDTDPSYDDDEITRGPIYSLSISYEIDTFTDTYASILFIIDEYSGGAHGMRFFETINVNLEEEEYLDLSDVISLSLEEISEYVKEDVKKQVETYSGEYSEENLWLEDGAFPREENFSRFTFNDTSVTFYFPPYQLGPYSLGTFRVNIPR